MWVKISFSGGPRCGIPQRRVWGRKGAEDINAFHGRCTRTCVGTRHGRQRAKPGMAVGSLYGDWTARAGIAAEPPTRALAQGGGRAVGVSQSDLAGRE